MSRERELDAWIDGLLADPQFHGHPLHQALARLRQQSLEQLVRLERIARISDGFQSMAREQNLSLSERYHKQLRRLEKVARISDRYQQMMRDLNLALKEASIRDPLTGLPNRRMLLERLREENERSQRHGQSYVLAMLDVDFFKQVNDTWGHDSGDRVLVEIARAMESELREYDLCGRWGGEEFLLLLPQTRLQDAGPVLERVRDSVRTLAVRVGTEALSVTASVGVTEHRIGETYSQTVNRADAALLDAKRSGRDKCVFAALPPLPAPSRPAPARFEALQPLQPHLASAEVHQQRLKRLEARHRQLQGQDDAVGAVVFGRHAGAQRQAARLEQRVVGEGTGEAHPTALDQLAARRLLQALGRAAAIGAGEAAGAELDATEPAADQHRHAVHVLSLDGRQDRPPGAAAGFAVVAEAVLRAALPGPAVVSGGSVAVGGDERLRLVLVGHRRGDGVEAALADFLAVFGEALQGARHRVQAAGGVSPQPLRMIRTRLSAAAAKSCLDMRLRPVTRPIWLAKSA